jgi:hypothetical protein
MADLQAALRASLRVVERDRERREALRQALDAVKAPIPPELAEVIRLARELVGPETRSPVVSRSHRRKGQKRQRPEEKTGE